MTKPKLKAVLLSLIVMLVLICTGILLFYTVPKTYAQANNGVYTFYGTEDTVHDPVLAGKYYEESHYRNTGILFYSSSNSGVPASGSSVKISTNNFFIDFTDAKPLYYTDDSNMVSYDDTKYRFDIINESGKVVWYAHFTGSSYTNPDTDVTTYTKIININGSTTTKTSKDKTILRFNAAEFGKRSITLNSGKYSISILRQYTWIKFITIYRSSSDIKGNLIVDYTAPTIKAQSTTSGDIIANESYVKEKVTFIASDTNHYRLYFKTPSSTSYAYTSSKTYYIGTAEGWYNVYAVDIVGNRSETFSVYYDSTVPIGRLSSSGTNVTSGSYISKSFSYIGTDNGSGIDTHYFKSPTTGDYQPYSAGTIIPANAGDGWYYFYSVDKSGNQSSIISVFLETKAPHVGIYRNALLAYDKSVTASGSFDTGIYLQPNDIIKINCSTSSGNLESNYPLNMNILIGTNYPQDSYTITIKSATGIVSSFKYYIVRDKPTFTIDGQTYNDGDTVYLSQDSLITWNCSDVINNTADTGLSIKSDNLDEFIKYKDGKSKTLTSANGTETRYTLSQTDMAGNTAEITVYIDKLKPSGTWESNGNTLENDGYTNNSLLFKYEEKGVTATYSYNGSEYRPYQSGKLFTADGTYTVVLIDMAGNKSTYTAHIDTIAPTGQLYSDYEPIEDGAITNGKIYFSWEGSAIATVNGNSYDKNAVLTNNDVYVFVLTDLAGNSTTYTITVDTVAPNYNKKELSDFPHMISKWYLVTIDLKDYSFANYEEALEFACKYEFSTYVTALNLDNIADFNQHHLVASNGNPDNNDDEVRTGLYWMYKSKANPDTWLYYFDRNLLNDVIAHYANDYVSDINYFDFNGDNNYGTPSGSMNDNLWTTDGISAPVLNGFVFVQTDSARLYAKLADNDTRYSVAYGVPFCEQFTDSGLYKLIEIDDAGNETVYYGYLDNIAPELIVTATIFGEANSTEFNITKESLAGIAAYYYESFNINAIIDADKWSVLTVESENNIAFYTYGDELPTLDVGGEYLISVYDRIGNNYAFTVYIVGSPAEISFDNNADDTAFELNIRLEQHFDTLMILEVRRNGEIISGISMDKLCYTFEKGGLYTVTLRDNFGRVIEQEYDFIKSLPSGELIGVDNEGKTKTDVKLIYDNGKYYVVVTKNGEVVEFANNGEIVITANDFNSGEYLIRLVNLTDEENYSDYRFIVNTFAPLFDISTTNGATTNKDVTVIWESEDIASVSYTLNGGDTVDCNNGEIFTEEGYYVITAINDLGTISEKSFTIDKTLDYTVTVNGEEVNTTEPTSGDIVVLASENLNVSVTINGVALNYAFGDSLTNEGKYMFRIWDDYGNTESFSMVIDKSVSYSANVGNGLISSEPIVFTADEKLTITVEKDKTVIDYDFGQTLTDEGDYKVTLRDSCGNEKEVIFRIVTGVKNSLDYTLGESVEVLAVERNGEFVQLNGNRLHFTVDGEYIINAKADGVTYTFKLILDTKAPTVVLNGVENGGIADGVVTITEPSEDLIIKVYFNEKLIEYEIGQELTEYGEYRVVVTDIAGNVSEYGFTLKHLLNSGAVALILLGIVLIVGLAISIIIIRKRGKFAKRKSRK